MLDTLSQTTLTFRSQPYIQANTRIDYRTRSSEARESAAILVVQTQHTVRVRVWSYSMVTCLLCSQSIVFRASFCWCNHGNMFYGLWQVDNCNNIQAKLISTRDCLQPDWTGQDSGQSVVTHFIQSIGRTSPVHCYSICWCWSTDGAATAGNKSVIYVLYWITPVQLSALVLLMNMLI